MKIKKPAEEMEVCDTCHRPGYLQKCDACSKQYCLTHQATVTGCVLQIRTCHTCGQREDVLAIVEKYAPLINAPRKERDAEIRLLNAEQSHP